MNEVTTGDGKRDYTCIVIFAAPQTAPAIGLPVLPIMRSTTEVNPFTEFRKLVKRDPSRRVFFFSF